MKKNLFILASAALALTVATSCSNSDDVYNPDAANEAKVAKFNQDFVSTFGTPAADQDWGFGETVLTNAGIASTKTRSSYDNHNLYGETYDTPDVIGDQERKDVVAWLRANPNVESVPVDWSDFSIQQVFKGTGDTYTYTAENGDKVLGSDNMNDLRDGTNSKINNFDKGTYNNDQYVTVGRRTYQNGAWVGSNDASYSYEDQITYIKAGSTKTFYYANATDGVYHSKINYDYKIHEIPYTDANGNQQTGYYLCLNFHATAPSGKEGNKNMTVQGDEYFDDWVVKIVPATYLNAKRVIAEDLATNESSDFDYNDVVFDVAYEKDWSTGTEKTYAIVTLQAAGGTKSLTVAGKEVHEAFGVSTDQMVNTNNGTLSKPVVVFRVEVSSTDPKDIAISVENQSPLAAEVGQPAEKLCVGTDFVWRNERESIKDASYYDNFCKYVKASGNERGALAEWWK